MQHPLTRNLKVKKKTLRNNFVGHIDDFDDDLIQQIKIIKRNSSEIEPQKDQQFQINNDHDSLMDETIQTIDHKFKSFHIQEDCEEGENCKDRRHVATR